MQEWTFGKPSGAEAGMKGWDVMYVSEDGKVEKLYAFIAGLSFRLSEWTQGHEEGLERFRS